jgi:Tol biopolymer transport system component
VLTLVLLLLVSLALAPHATAAPRQRIVWLHLDRALGLYLSDSDGRNERPLLVGSGSSYNPSFSSDGRWIVFTSERFGSADIFRVHPDGSGLERLTDSPAFDDQGTLSPDGRILAFVSTRDGGTANIWLLDTRTDREVNLTKNRAGNFRPSWSPDGKWIAFSSDRDAHQGRYVRANGASAWELMQTTAIYVVHPDGSGLKRLTPLEGTPEVPAGHMMAGRCCSTK